MAAPYRNHQPYGAPSLQRTPYRSDSDLTQTEMGTYHQHMIPKDARDAEDLRMRGGMTRTPSPTPSEQRELKTGVFDWKALATLRFWFRREWLWYYIALFIILVITALVTIYHTQIVHWLTPVTQWMHDLKFGWLVPIGVLFVISFPPLFGHEIVAILCGLVWGLWFGFGIVCAGTFLGEVGNFYAFKFCCRARGEKLEKSKLSYACLAQVVRDGGFTIALVARLSAIPGHFTTAVFSACGMGIIVFSIAAILSLPKQFITVYLGVILEQSGEGTKSTQSRIISDVVLGVTFLITLLAMWYIFHKMNKAKPGVIYQRRKARQAKLARGDYSPYISAFPSETASALSSYEHPDVIPLKAQTSPNPTPYIAYPNSDTPTSPNHLYAPQPRHGPGVPGYGHLYEASTTNASTDDVGWDMRPIQHARAEQMYGHPMGPSESSETVIAAHQGGGGATGGYDTYGYDEAYNGLREEPEPISYAPITRSQGQSSPSRSPRPPPSHPPSLNPRHLTSSPESRPTAVQTPVQAQYASWIPPDPDPTSDISLEGPLPSPPFHQTYQVGPTAMAHDHDEEARPTRALASSPPPPSYHTDIRR